MNPWEDGRGVKYTVTRTESMELVEAAAGANVEVHTSIPNPELFISEKSNVLPHISVDVPRVNHVNVPRGVIKTKLSVPLGVPALTN